MKLAACLLVLENTSPGRVLSVSRRDDTTKWGMPGGKVDEYETSCEACQREASEEVGIIAGQTEYMPLFSAVSAGDVTFWVTTYLWVGTPIELDSLCAEKGLTISWKTWDEICDPAISPFAVYNQQVRQAYEIYQRAALNEVMKLHGR